MNQLLGKTLSEIAQMDFLCECQERHYTDIKDIIIGKGVIGQLTDIMRRQLGDKGQVLVSMDTNTKAAAGNLVLNLLKEAGYESRVHCFPGEPELVSSKENYEELYAQVEEGTGLLIAVGSGTLNDITKYVSYHTGIPFYIVATAPSMDGYASTVAPMVWEGLKYAFPAVGPAAIIGDIDIIKTAPKRMRAAGFGDIVGKCVSICDWKLASIIRDEPYCQMIADNVLLAMERCAQNIEGLMQGDDEALQNVMEALVLCGLMMNYMKNSRPASGSEHNFSHAVELMQLYHGQPLSMHGEAVGVGSLISSVIYHKFRKEEFDFADVEKRISTRSRKDWDTVIRGIPVEGTEDMIKMEDELGKNLPKHCLANVEKLIQNKDLIMEIIDTYIPDPDVMKNHLLRCKAMSTPQELGISEEDFKIAVLYAKDMRYRYSILQLVWDLGKEKEYLEEARNYFYS